MARLLVRQAHGGEIMTIYSGALPYFLNQGYVVLDEIDDSDDSLPLYLSKVESDARYVNIDELLDEDSPFALLLSSIVEEKVADAMGGVASAIVVHGDDPNVARPSVAVPVIWYGTVDPVNADDGLDVYVSVI